MRTVKRTTDGPRAVFSTMFMQIFVWRTGDIWEQDMDGQGQIMFSGIVKAAWYARNRRLRKITPSDMSALKRNRIFREEREVTGNRMAGILYRKASTLTSLRN